MADCPFCKIARGQLTANVVFQDNDYVAFADIKPQAPHHYLVIPRDHVNNLNDIDASTRRAVTKMLEVAAKVAKKQGISQTGYRCVINNGKDAGQEVAHLHLHILGGRPLTWPPG